MNNIKYKFYVSGTHCASCKIFIEDTLKEKDFIKNATVDLGKETLEIEINVEKDQNELAQILTQYIEQNGYRVSVDRKNTKESYDVFWKALPIGLVILILFFLIQKSGILNIGIGGKITPFTSFIIGIIASFSSCLAVVGGLVLSLSAKLSEDNVNDNKTFILFHFSRIITFLILGGLLGFLGNAIGVNFLFTTILGIVASLVMIILGFNLIGIFKKNKITIPSKLFNFFKNIKQNNFSPVILGFATFFLPCGFTQSMQITALSSGSFLSGALIMFGFALGTLPVLLFLSFGSSSFAKSKYGEVFFKSAGVVVIGLGLFALLSALAGLGIINPLFNI